MYTITFSVRISPCLTPTSDVKNRKKTRTVSHLPLTEYSILLHIRLFVYTSQIVNILVASFYHTIS